MLIPVCLALLFAADRSVVGQFEINWATVDGGGAMSSSGGAFDLSGAIGQPDAQTPPVMNGGSFQLTGGFWAISQVCFCLGDLNGDGQKDGRDIQRFVGCVLAGGNCSCADVDGAGGVTLADVNAFAADLLSGATCP
jgi:hypothetical protein